MSEILAAPQRIDFLTALWLFPVTVALHESEEWNLVAWYRGNYVELPPLSDRGLRAWILFSSALGFLWTGLAVLPGSPAVAAWALVLAFALMAQNGLLHVYWLFYFRGYAPGAITSVLLMLPAIACLAVRAVRGGLCALVVPDGVGGATGARAGAGEPGGRPDASLILRPPPLLREAHEQVLRHPGNARSMPRVLDTSSPLCQAHYAMLPGG